MTVSETWHDLDVEMNGEDDDFETPPEAIVGDEQANRTLGRLARVRRERAREHGTYQDQLDQLNAWWARRTEIHDNAEQWYRRQLEGYHAAVLELDARRKTIDLPNGVLRSNAGQPKWEFDEKAFVEWALHNAHADLVRVKYEPDKTVAKKTLQADVESGKAVTVDGEVAPGVTVSPAVRSFTVDTEPTR